MTEYLKTWQAPAQVPESLFLEVIKIYAERLYTKETATCLLRQLAQKPLVSTIDHLGVWGHPIFVNATTFFSLAFNQNELVPVFATESVSLNNTTSWSGSILQHQDAEKINRLSFFYDKQKTFPVFFCPSIFKTRYSEILQHLPDGFMPKQLPKKENFSLQACILTQHIWKAVFCAPIVTGKQIGRAHV